MEMMELKGLGDASFVLAVCRRVLAVVYIIKTMTRENYT